MRYIMWKFVDGGKEQRIFPPSRNFAFTIPFPDKGDIKKESKEKLHSRAKILFSNFELDRKHSSAYFPYKLLL